LQPPETKPPNTGTALPTASHPADTPPGMVLFLPVKRRWNYSNAL